MKIIDVLNKIANGEEVPKKIRLYCRIWQYDNKEKDYVSKYERLLNYQIEEITKKLNDEIEIIEEDKKIEKINVWYEYNGKDDKVLVKIMLDELKDKINEIIDYINKGEQ